MNRIFDLFLEPAIEKGLRDLEANPSHTMRYLVDLALKMSTSPQHQRSLQTLRRALEDEACGYYRLFPDIARRVDRDSLKTICRNLIRNVLGSGSERISQLENALGRSIPRGIVFDMQQIEGPPDSAPLEALIQQSKGLGIYCYLFLTGPQGYGMAELAPLFSRHSECIFAVIAPPRAFLQGDAVPCLNTVYGILMGQDRSAAQNAATQLAKRRALYGGCVAFGARDNPSALIQAGADLELAFLLLLEDGTSTNLAQARTQDLVTQARESGQYPIIPFYIPPDDPEKQLLRIDWSDGGEQWNKASL